jgi:hypothetical protein
MSDFEDRWKEIVQLWERYKVLYFILGIIIGFFFTA